MADGDQGAAGDDGGWVRRSSRYLFRSQWFCLRQDELTLPTGEDITYTLVDPRIDFEARDG